MLMCLIFTEVTYPRFEMEHVCVCSGTRGAFSLLSDRQSFSAKWGWYLQWAQHWALLLCPVAGEMSYRHRFPVLSTPFYHWAGASCFGTEGPRQSRYVTHALYWLLVPPNLCRTIKSPSYPHLLPTKPADPSSPRQCSCNLPLKWDFCAVSQRKPRQC